MRTAEPHDPEARLQFRFDGQLLEAPAGTTIAGALIANGIVSWRRSRVTGAQRGLFCGIGTCFDCLVDVNHSAAVRACMIPLSAGDDVRTSNSLGGGRA
jgi:predicted molibdopterin-dependent oxidoreductase YjgC